MMSWACFTQGMWSGRSWGASYEKEKERGKSLKRQWNQIPQSVIHIPKSLHVPRKPESAQKPSKKELRDTQWGWWPCEVGENPVHGLLRRDINGHYLWSDWKVSLLWKRQRRAVSRPLDPRVWSLGLRSQICWPGTPRSQAGECCRILG